MRILLYQCAEAPQAKRFAAIYLDGSGALPVIHYGSDPEAVREKAQAWWDEQAAKAPAKACRPPPRRKRAAEADPGDII